LRDSCAENSARVAESIARVVAEGIAIAAERIAREEIEIVCREGIGDWRGVRRSDSIGIVVFVRESCRYL
jgi:hypothetical protein